MVIVLVCKIGTQKQLVQDFSRWVTYLLQRFSSAVVLLRIKKGRVSLRYKRITKSLRFPSLQSADKNLFNRISQTRFIR